MLKQPDDFEIRVIRYAHRVLLLLFLGTLIVVGLRESAKRIHDIGGNAQYVPVDKH
jgi:hypothetical protein